MKAFAHTLLSALVLFPLAGCFYEEGENRTVFQVDSNANRKPQGSRFGFGSDRNRDNAGDERRDTHANPRNDAAVEPPVDPGAGSGDPAGPGPEIGPQLDPDAGPATTGDAGDPTPATVPFAEHVPGKSGFVWSPFAPGKMIDVVGYPPGTLVKCPHTGKQFKVP